MHPDNFRYLSKAIFIGVFFTALGCDGGSKNSGDPATTQSEASAAVEGTNEEGVILDYPKAYCEHVGKIQLRTDISEKIGFICQDGAPTADMLEFREKALAQAPGEIELVMLESRHIEEQDFSEFLIAWAFHAPIRPFEVKNRPIYEFVAQGFSSDDVTLNVATERQPDDSLDSGLHLWSVNMTYDLSVRGTTNRFLVSQRQTQYNLYQVLSGNEEMGLGVENLIDTNNPDFDMSTMVNFSFNDGKGYNDGNGGTIVITMLHFIINNHGFPETAASSIQEVAQHTADVMYNGLKDE
ncbi:MAG: hypothetical protein ACOH5I_08410 [Oligoflexus sp.]